MSAPPATFRERPRPVRAVEPHAAGDVAGRARGLPLDLSDSGAARAGANIYTVHDLVQFRLPYTTLDWKRYHLRLMRAILRKADHIVTVSENSKHDIMSLFE